MDEEEDDRGEILEFGFSDSNLSKDIEDYLLLFENKSTKNIPLEDTIGKNRTNFCHLHYFFVMSSKI